LLSKKKSIQRKRRAHPRQEFSRAKPAGDAESPAAQAITVFWMTSLLATVLAELCGLAARMVVLLVDAPPSITLLSNLLLLVAALAGLVCLALTPAVLRWRRVPPPVAITRFAIGASLLPLAAVAAILLGL
jgi:hypothetical protein